MSTEDFFSLTMDLNASDCGRSFCASVVEDVLQQHKGRSSDIFASRRAEESASRRYEAAGWLRKMVGVVGSRDLPNEPSEDAFLLGLRNGMVLCYVLNKVHPGAVPKVVENPVDLVHLPDGAPLSAFQYFENVRNFLDAIEEMGLPTFEASDLEKGGSCTKVVNCILALKSYQEWKQTGANGSWKFGSITKPPAMGKCNLRVGKNSEPFMNTFRNMLQTDPNVMSGQNAGRHSNGFPVDLSFDFTKMGASGNSLDNIVRAILSDKQPEEVPKIVESLLTKVMEEFERRFSSQNEQVRANLRNLVVSDDKQPLSSAEVRDNLRNLVVSDDKQSLSSAEFSAAPSSACGETTEDADGAAGGGGGRDASFEQQENKDELQTDELSSSISTSKEDDESRIRKQFLFDQQQEEIKGLKHALQSTKAGIQLMQNKYCEDFCLLGRHLQSLAHAASEYHKVLDENRQLYNQVQDLKGSIRVYCRVRPFLPGQQSGLSSVDHISDGSIAISNPVKQDKGSRKSFNFSKVFGSSASQEEVFADTKPLIRSVLDGYNVCIFAYGQTGAGKTYTMTGPKQITAESQGVNFRALNDLFHISEERKDSFTYTISVQMIEIYNEQIRDLLASDSNKRLEIRNSSQQNGFNVPDANLVPVKSTSDVIELMDIGQKNRAVCSTALNDRSSRSHSCLTVHIQGRDIISGSTIRACLHLVDLAGSERVDKSEVTGTRLKEAQHINKSLSALGDVIAALAQKNSHIPYRNSKLTQLLQDSLGGQAKTLMFVNISPEVDAIGETLSTLKFAERVSSVELGAARVNKESGEVKELREQIASLKAALARKEAETDVFASARCSPEREIAKSNLLSPMQDGHSNHRQPMEEVGNLTFQCNSFGGQKKVSHGQREISTDPISGEWVDKVIVNVQECGEETLLRCLDNDNGPVPDMFYQKYTGADMEKVYPGQFDPMNRKENHDNNVLPRSDSMTTDDMDDIEVATSDSSEADLLWQLSSPSSTGTIQTGASKLKNKSKLPNKSPDMRSTKGLLHSRKPPNGGGQLLQKGSAVLERKKSAGKLRTNGSGK